eukprot:COSAG06_NODE_3032_length_5939_cov_4.174114_4_plen_93_part_00
MALALRGLHVEVAHDLAAAVLGALLGGQGCNTLLVSSADDTAYIICFFQFKKHCAMRSGLNLAATIYNDDSRMPARHNPWKVSEQETHQKPT